MDKTELIQQLLSLLTQKENTDSLEFSTPAKGGGVKVYLDYNDLEGAKKKIDNAIAAREYANSKLEAK